ncbi:MAG TPA: FG-GAP-like repeat-containing protein [Verrucomicrobiae bacterium]|nr:FG-GAP-like repeat-containing protein [Verrucomicrobiae bacterium]
MKRFVSSLAAIGSLLTFTIAASAQPFALSSVVSNTYDAAFVAVGDLNGDGKPDLVSVDNDSTFTVATNAGHGIFLSNATYNVGSGNAPAAVAIADINGDGKQDVIVANQAQNAVVIFTNAGGGLLVSNATYSVGQTPIFLVVTDINGDGKPDIITANNSDGTLTILTNSAGRFPVALTIPVDSGKSSTFSFAVADLNGDNKPDIAAGDWSNGWIEVLTNAGGGNFVSNAVYQAGGPPGQGPLSVVAADFNHDGKMDIASANSDRTLTIFTNAGNGILVQSQLISDPLYPYAPPDYSLMAADVDGDGYPDLLVSGSPDGGNSAFFLTLYNSGSGGTFVTDYTGSTEVVNTPVPYFTSWSVATDINGDGKPDLIGVVTSLYGQATPEFYVMTNGVGSFPNSISVNVYTNLNSAPVTNIIVEATGPSGAVVNFSTTATNWTGTWPVTNTPPSGSTFPLGVNLVTASTGYFIKSNIAAQTNYIFTVKVQDTTAPALTLLGANPLTNYVGFYADPGCIATDIVSGNLTGSIVLAGDLNTNAPGTYTVTYSATDGAGNTSTTNRTVVMLLVPTLGVAASRGNQTAVFWPLGETNFILQSTTNLASGKWESVPNAVPLTGSYVSNSGPAMFFRIVPQ